MRRIFLLALFLLVADTVWSQTLCTENRCVKLQDELGFYVDAGNPLPVVESTVSALVPCTENRCVKLADKDGNYISATNPLPVTGGGGGGGGTVTNFSAGNLSPLFTTSVATATTTPALTFALSNAAAHTFFANNTGSSGAPSFTSFVAGVDYLAPGGAGFVSSITGTALQITASAATGAVTLSIPAVASIATSLTVPLHIGGTTTTSPLTLQSTSGVGTTGADIIFLTGNNGATEVARMLNSGFVGIGSTTPAVQLQVSSTSASDPRGIMSAQYTTDAIGARIHLRKARGTEASPTTIVTGDVLGRVRFSGYDGSNYLQMGSIDVTSTGTIASTRVPTQMTFSTATDAAPSVLTTALTIDAAQKVGIGVTPAFTLDVLSPNFQSIHLKRSGGSGGSVFKYENGNGDFWVFGIGDQSADASRFAYRFNDATETGEKFTLLQGGNVGIRAINPAVALDIRNSTTATNLRLANTYTDASNNEYLQLGFTSNVATLSTVANGTGTQRLIEIVGRGVKITGGTITDQVPALLVSGTIPSSASAFNSIANVQATSHDSGKNAYPFNLDFLAGATEAQFFAAGRFNNVVAGTGTASISTLGGGASNVGIIGQAGATTTGHNIGVQGYVNNSSGLNIGGLFQTASNTGAALAAQVGNGITADIFRAYNFTTQVAAIASTGNFNFATGKLVAFGSVTAPTVGITDNASGVLEINNGTACSTVANCRDLKWRHSIASGTAPTVANTSANSCGTTAATIAGGDMAGKVTVGATSGTSCTVTFGTAWTNAPACAVNNETTSNLARATSTTTTVILAGTFVGGDVVSYTCQGY